MEMSVSEMLELQERRLEYVKNIFSSEKVRENIIVYKLLHRAAVAAGLDLREPAEETLLDSNTFMFYQSELLSALNEIDWKRPRREIRSYATGDLSKFFGVSHTTINKWITAGRFKNVVRVPGKHVEVSGDTEFTYPSNAKVVTVQEAADRFEERQRIAMQEVIEEPEEVFVAKRIAQYEEKYGSIESLEEAVDSGNTDGDLDLDVWRYLLRRRLLLV